MLKTDHLPKGRLDWGDHVESEEADGSNKYYRGQEWEKRKRTLSEDGQSERVSKRGVQRGSLRSRGGDSHSVGRSRPYSVERVKRSGGTPRDREDIT